MSFGGDPWVNFSLKKQRMLPRFLELLIFSESLGSFVNPYIINAYKKIQTYVNIPDANTHTHIYIYEVNKNANYGFLKNSIFFFPPQLFFLLLSLMKNGF